MNIKRYIAKDVTEAMEQLKEELGKDAVILNQRNIRRAGLMGFFQKPLVEVVAAYEPKEKARNPLPSLVPQKSEPVEPHEAAALNILEKLSRQQTQYTPGYTVQQQKQQTTPQTSQDGSFRPLVLNDAITGQVVKSKAASEDREKIEALETKIDTLSSTINSLVGKLSLSKDGFRENYPAEIEVLLLSLLENEVHEEFAHKIAREVSQIVSKQEAPAEEVMEQILRQYIGEPGPLKLKRYKRTVVMLVGPTGVGKTTTLAKLAAIYQLNHHSKVGVITTDTYRIAAVEQLKTYAEILEVPLSIVYSASEIQEALKEHEDKDIVFVDTAGKSPQDKTLEEEINSLIKYSDCDEVHLVLSATTGFSGMLNILNTYSFLRDFKMIITKVDETPTWGMLLNAKFLTDKPISYVTEGQTVPDDIEVLNPRKVIDRLLGKREEYKK